MTGYALTGSFCTLHDSLLAMRALVGRGVELVPIMSEITYSTDTRFFMAEELRARVREICGRDIIHTVPDAEPFGRSRLDALVIAPCTGNTLAKIANGITDTAVTMAAKAHLRCDGRLLIALASNDAMSQNLKNIGTLLTRRSVYFLPMHQDDPVGKPHSLVAELGGLPEAYDAMMRGEAVRPIFLV